MTIDAENKPAENKPSLLLTFSRFAIEAYLARRMFTIVSRTLRTLNETKLGRRWRIRSMGFEGHPTQTPYVMFDGYWADMNHVATITIRYTDKALVPAERKFFLLPETCSLGPETTELYKVFREAAEPAIDYVNNKWANAAKEPTRTDAGGPFP